MILERQILEIERLLNMPEHAWDYEDYESQKHIMQDIRSIHADEITVGMVYAYEAGLEEGKKSQPVSIPCDLDGLKRILNGPTGDAMKLDAVESWLSIQRKREEPPKRSSITHAPLPMHGPSRSNPSENSYTGT